MTRTIIRSGWIVGLLILGFLIAGCGGGGGGSSDNGPRIVTDPLRLDLAGKKGEVLSTSLTIKETSGAADVKNVRIEASVLQMANGKNLATFPLSEIVLGDVGKGSESVKPFEITIPCEQEAETYQGTVNIISDNASSIPLIISITVNSASVCSKTLASSSIGSAGGNVTVATGGSSYEGLSLTIPANTLAQTSDISIISIKTDGVPQAAPSSLAPLNGPFLIAPAETTLNGQATLRFPYTTLNNQGVNLNICAFYRITASGWEKITTTRDTTDFIAHLTQFGYYQLAEEHVLIDYNDPANYFSMKVYNNWLRYSEDYKAMQDDPNIKTIAIFRPDQAISNSKSIAAMAAARSEYAGETLINGTPVLQSGDLIDIVTLETQKNTMISEEGYKISQSIVSFTNNDGQTGYRFSIVKKAPLGVGDDQYIHFVFYQDIDGMVYSVQMVSNLDLPNDPEKAMFYSVKALKDTTLKYQP